MEDKLKPKTMWMACDKIRNCLTLEVCPQWSKRQLIEWMENSICAEDWKKLYNPVRVTITPILPKKRREGVKLEAFESDIEKVIKGE